MREEKKCSSRKEIESRREIGGVAWLFGIADCSRCIKFPPRAWLVLLPPALRRKFLLTFALRFRSRDFRTSTSRNFFVIFFLTSFFINSIHQLVAVEDHCTFSMMNGRENRNNGNQEEGEEEKEALRRFSTKSKGDA
jgi:hypothetical protein